MRRGFLYVVAVMDWATRKVLSWRLSNTVEADVCIEALQEALTRYGAPEIFNTGQGSQFTSPRFVEVVQAASARVTMDGRGRWMDNVHRTALAPPQVRVRLPARFRGRLGAAGWARALDRLLQRGEAPLGAQRQDPYQAYGRAQQDLRLAA